MSRRRTVSRGSPPANSSRVSGGRGEAGRGREGWAGLSMTEALGPGWTVVNQVPVFWMGKADEAAKVLAVCGCPPFGSGKCCKYCAAEQRRSEAVGGCECEGRTTARRDDGAAAAGGWAGWCGEPRQTANECDRGRLGVRLVGKLVMPPAGIPAPALGMLPTDIDAQKQATCFIGPHYNIRTGELGLQRKGAQDDGCQSRSQRKRHCAVGAARAAANDATPAPGAGAGGGGGGVAAAVPRRGTD